MFNITSISLKHLRRWGLGIALTALFSLAATGAYAKKGKPFREIHEVIDEINAQLATLDQELDSLSATVDEHLISSMPVSVDVDCTAGELIAPVLDEYADSFAPLTINVSGVCVETLFILRDDITINGISADAEIHSLATAFGSLTLSSGVADVSVNNIKLSGGLGVIVARNSQSDFTNVDFTQSTYGVLSVDGSHVAVENSIARNNAVGFLATRGGIATIINSVAEQNNAGIIASDGGIVTVTNRASNGAPGPGSIVRNNITGVSVQTGGRLIVTGSRIELNADTGVILNTLSTAHFTGAPNVVSNNPTGIRALKNTGLFFDGQLTEISNSNIGIQCLSPDVSYLVSGAVPGPMNNNVTDVAGCTGP